MIRKPSKVELGMLVFGGVMLSLCAIFLIIMQVQNKNQAAEYEQHRAELTAAYQNGTTQEQMAAALELCFGQNYAVIQNTFADGTATVVLHAADEPTQNVVKEYTRDTVFLMSWAFGIPDVEKLSVTFKHTFLDRGGNEVLEDGFVIGISRENATDINYENFANMVWEDPTRLTDRADGYLIIPALRE